MLEFIKLKKVPGRASGHNALLGTLQLIASSRWSSAGAEGALVFCADRAKGGLWFRVVDLTVRTYSPITFTGSTSSYGIFSLIEV